MALREWVPAKLVDLAITVSGRGSFAGAYPDFASAVRASDGYEAPSAVQPIVAGAREWLRSFDPKGVVSNPRVLQVLAAMAPAISRKKTVRVLDVGGSSGSYFHEIRRAVPETSWDWTVLETPALASAMQEFTTDSLRFVDQPDGESYDVVLLSGFLQYVERPYDEMKRLCALGEFAIITRCPLVDGPDVVSVQRLRTGASYPAWFFSEKNFVSALSGLGRVLMRWDVIQDNQLFQGKRWTYQGFLLQMR